MALPGQIPVIRISGYAIQAGVLASCRNGIFFRSSPIPSIALQNRLYCHKVTGGKFGPGFSAVKLDHPRRIGVIAGGVGDGISPKHAASGHVLIRGKKIPIASAICLEHMIVDLTECPEAKMGDEVVLFGSQGNENIPISEIGRASCRERV